MGKKPRSKGVDVTKSFLQSTSVSDFITVQVSANNTVTVSEDELSPTQGSEAAFALRRDGKLDSTMKLCLNWRGGACHNYAACTFAHIKKYYGVDGSHASTGNHAADGAGAAGTTANTSSSVAGGTTSTTTGAGEARSPWLAKVAPSASSGAARAQQTGWFAKGTATAASNHGFVDLVDAMAAKTPLQTHSGRTAASDPVAKTTAQAPSRASPTGGGAATATVGEATEPPSIPSTSANAVAGGRVEESTAPAVRELLLNQVTGGSAASPVGVPSTPRHQGVPAPHSAMFSTSPFSRPTYTAVPQVSPTLGHPSPAIRQLMHMLTADD